MSVCEQEHVILSVMCQDLFPLELLGTGHFWRTQKCVGRGSGFLTLENLQAAMLEQRNDLSDLHEDRKTSENTESPFFLINPATGVCHVRNLWWVCMFCILRAGLAKRLLLWSVWERFFFFSCITAVVVFDQGTKAPESVCSNSFFSKHDSLWMPAKAFITSFYSYKGRGWVLVP